MSQVDITNTNNPAEPKPDKYTLPFKQDLIDLVLSGAKAKTYRFGTKFDYLNVGDEVRIQNSKTKEVVCTAVITVKQWTTFGELPIIEPGHEPYSDKEHQREVFSGYYAYIGRLIEDADPFLILEFQLKG